MTGQFGRQGCDNLNHRHQHASVRHCPGCGGIVNERVGTRQCNEAQHAAARRQRNPYCVDCGTRLISAR